MKILFINISSLDIPAGTTYRLSYEISELIKYTDIHVLTLGNNLNSNKLKQQYRKVNFNNFDLKFKGWNVVNIDEFMNFIVEYDKKESFDSILLNIEIWSIIRKISMHPINKKTSVIFHAIPFIGYLHNPTFNFNKDVFNRIQNESEIYRKEFIVDYYQECKRVLGKINYIASSKTNEFLAKKYFPKIKVHLLKGNPNLKNVVFDKFSKKTFDFVYMARIEDGKGSEFLKDILLEIDKIIESKVSLVILGRIDDEKSRKNINEIINFKFKKIKVYYKGNANDLLKQKILSNSKIFLYPSLYDNNPTVIYEALSYGLPIVVWSTLFIKFMFEQEHDFVKIVPAKDFKKYALKCCEMLKDNINYKKKINHFSKNKLISSKKVAINDFKLFKDIYEKY